MKKQYIILYVTSTGFLDQWIFDEEKSAHETVEEILAEGAELVKVIEINGVFEISNRIRGSYTDALQSFLFENGDENSVKN